MLINVNDTVDKDWEDIKFGVDNQIDFYAVSFVKDAKVVYELKDYLKSNVLHLHLLCITAIIPINDSTVFMVKFLQLTCRLQH